jgi:hypothetical protein
VVAIFISCTPFPPWLQMRHSLAECIRLGFDLINCSHQQNLAGTAHCLPIRAAAKSFRLVLSLIDVRTQLLGKGHCLNVGSAKTLFTIPCP